MLPVSQQVRTRSFFLWDNSASNCCPQHVLICIIKLINVQIWAHIPSQVSQCNSDTVSHPYISLLLYLHNLSPNPSLIDLILSIIFHFLSSAMLCIVLGTNCYVEKEDYGIFLFLFEYHILRIGIYMWMQIYCRRRKGIADLVLWYKKQFPLLLESYIKHYQSNVFYEYGRMGWWYNALSMIHKFVPSLLVLIGIHPKCTSVFGLSL